MVALCRNHCTCSRCTWVSQFAAPLGLFAAPLHISSWIPPNMSYQVIMGCTNALCFTSIYTIAGITRKIVIKIAFSEHIFHICLSLEMGGGTICGAQLIKKQQLTPCRLHSSLLFLINMTHACLSCDLGAVPPLLAIAHFKITMVIYCSASLIPIWASDSLRPWACPPLRPAPIRYIQHQTIIHNEMIPISIKLPRYYFGDGQYF